MPLVGCEPVADPSAELPDAAHTPNASNEIVAEQTAVGGRFIYDKVGYEVTRKIEQDVEYPILSVLVLDIFV